MLRAFSIVCNKKIYNIHGADFISIFKKIDEWLVNGVQYIEIILDISPSSGKSPKNLFCETR
jgi:hypothetical protein